jgi:hypothetical protein
MGFNIIEVMKRKVVGYLIVKSSPAPYVFLSALLVVAKQTGIWRPPVILSRQGVEVTLASCRVCGLYYQTGQS